MCYREDRTMLGGNPPYMDMARSRALSLGVLLALGLTGALGACGSSFDIDALGAGARDGGANGDDSSKAGTAKDDGGGGDPDGSDKPKGDGGGSKPSSDMGDGGWHAETGEDGGPWVAAGWQKMTSNSSKNLNAVWGATSTSVWAGGDQATLLFFDGTAWSSRASSLSASGRVWAIAGSATDDVYLLELRSGGGSFSMFLHHFDGAMWSEVTSFPGIGEIGCLDVPARGVAYVYGAPQHAFTPSAADALRLYRVVGTTNAGSTYLGSTSYVSGSGRCGVHAFAPNDVWVSGNPIARFDGAAFAPLAGSSPSSDLVSVVTPSLAFTALHVWNGVTWQMQTTGVAGALGSVTGRSSSPAFGIVNGVAGHIVRYSNGGWTEDTIPADTDLLADIFMAPNGRAFAVGLGGTILTGP
jgi:hypothetical protein